MLSEEFFPVLENDDARSDDDEQHEAKAEFNE